MDAILEKQRLRRERANKMKDNMGDKLLDMLGKKLQLSPQAGAADKSDAFQSKLATFMEAGARIKAEQDARKAADLKVQESQMVKKPVKFKVKIDDSKKIDVHSMIQAEHKVSHEDIQKYLQRVLDCQSRVGNPADDIGHIFNKIVKWKQKFGNLDQQEKEISKLMKSKVTVHNIKSILELMGNLQHQISLTEDEITIMIFTCIDHDHLTNLMIQAGEFMKWFNLNFEGESTEERDFQESKETVFLYTCQQSRTIIHLYQTLDDKQMILHPNWWNVHRYSSIGSHLKNNLFSSQEKIKVLRSKFKETGDRMSYYTFFYYLEYELNIKLSLQEQNELESRLDRFGMAYIEFNNFNEFCKDFEMDWGEPVHKDDSDDVLEYQLNISYSDYQLSQDDYFQGRSTILTSEKAALAQAYKLFELSGKGKTPRKKGQLKVKYIDKDFGPVDEHDLKGGANAMYKTGEIPKKGYPEPSEVKWVHAETLCKKGQKPQFVDDGVASSDCIQGKLGDCWLISALSVLATRDELLVGGRRGMELDEDMIIDKDIAHLLSQGVYPPIFHQFRSIGLYVIRIFKDFQWIYVIVDDRIPVDVKGLPVFGRCQNLNEIWVPIIEKAYAKIHGCYENLISGYVDEGVQELTGFQSEKILIRDEKTGLFPHKMIQNYGGEKGFWNFLLQRDQDGCLLGCSIKGYGKEGPQVTEGQPTGLILNHAYGINDVLELDDPFHQFPDSKLRLLRLRNPWGNSEWLGEWSSGSEMLTKYDSVINAYISSLPPDEQFEVNADDGTFFMHYDDWIDSMSTLFINIDFPDAWCGVRFSSRWTAINSGGLPNKDNQDLKQRFAKNPQFTVSSAYDCEIMFSLTQLGGRLPQNGKYYNYPFSETLLYAAVAIFRLDANQNYLEAFDKEKLVFMSPVKLERENTGRCILKAGQKYVIICSTEIHGKTGQFYLSIYFNQNLRYMNLRRVFHHLDTNTHQEGIWPQLIPEEAEKQSSKTPFWKIQLVKSSLKFMITDEDNRQDTSQSEQESTISKKKEESEENANKQQNKNEVQNKQETKSDHHKKANKINDSNKKTQTLGSQSQITKNIQAKQFQPKSGPPQTKVKVQSHQETEETKNKLVKKVHNQDIQAELKVTLPALPIPTKKTQDSKKKSNSNEKPETLVLTDTHHTKSKTPIKKPEPSKDPKFQGGTFKKQQKEAESTALKKQVNSQDLQDANTYVADLIVKTSDNDGAHTLQTTQTMAVTSSQVVQTKTLHTEKLQHLESSKPISEKGVKNSEEQMIYRGQKSKEILDKQVKDVISYNSSDSSVIEAIMNGQTETDEVGQNQKGNAKVDQKEAMVRYIDRPVEVVKEVIVEKEVIRYVDKPVVEIKEVQVIKEVEVVREVEKVVERERIVEVVKEVIKEVEVIKEIFKEVEIIREVPVEVIKYVDREVQSPQSSKKSPFSSKFQTPSRSSNKNADISIDDGLSKSFIKEQNTEMKKQLYLRDKEYNSVLKQLQELQSTHKKVKFKQMKELLDVVENQDREICNLKILTDMKKKEEFLKNKKMNDLVGFFSSEMGSDHEEVKIQESDQPQWYVPDNESIKNMKVIDNSEIEKPTIHSYKDHKFIHDAIGAKIGSLFKQKTQEYTIQKDFKEGSKETIQYEHKEIQGTKLTQQMNSQQKSGAYKNVFPLLGQKESKHVEINTVQKQELHAEVPNHAIVRPHGMGIQATERSPLHFSEKKEEMFSIEMKKASEGTSKDTLISSSKQSQHQLFSPRGFDYEIKNQPLKFVKPQIFYLLRFSYEEQLNQNQSESVIEDVEVGALSAGDIDELDRLMKQSLSQGEVNEPYICILNQRLFRSNCYKEETAGDLYDDYLRLIGQAVASGQLSIVKYQGKEYELDFKFKRGNEETIEFEDYFLADNEGKSVCFPCVCNNTETKIFDNERPIRLEITAQIAPDTSHLKSDQLIELMKHKKQCEDPDDDIHECFGELLVCKLNLFNVMFSDELKDYGVKYKLAQ